MMHSHTDQLRVIDTFVTGVPSIPSRTTWRLRVGAIAVSLAILATSVSHASAQYGVQIEQTVTNVYGDHLQFDLKATGAFPFTEAHLIIEELHHGVVYAEAVGITPGETVAATQGVSIKTLALSAFAQLTYHWTLTDQSAATFLSDPQSFLYEDNRVPWQWQVVQRGNISIHSDGRDVNLAQSALAIAAASFAHSSEMLGDVTTNEEMHVYLYPELASLAASLRLHQLRIQDWVAAFAIPDQRIILVAASSDAAGLANLQRDLSHEMTHLAIYSATGEGWANIPAWLNEGLALSSSTAFDTDLSDRLNMAIGSGVLLSVDSLCVRNYGGLTPRDAALAYAQSASLVHYILNRYGASQVRALLDAYAAGRSCNDGAILALGVTLDQLETQWHSDLSGSAVQTPHDNGSAMTWLIVWVVSLILAGLFIIPPTRRQVAPSSYETRMAMDSVPDQPV